LLKNQSSAIVPLYISGNAMMNGQKMAESKPTSDTEFVERAEGAEAAGAEPLTPAQIGDLKSRAAKADEHWQRLLRATADSDNFKKRAQREREESIKFANESLIKKLIPVLDNFDMALQASQGQTDAPQSLQTGIAMIYQQLRSALLESGLEEVDATGKVFDPNWHEAVSQQPSSEVPEGHVLQQLRKGYKLRDRLIRPATVVVARKP
jgi:molecular chaperone GrpE